MRLIPIYLKHGKQSILIGRRTEVEVAKMSNLELRIRNGKIKRAYIVARHIALIPLARDGYCFEQELSCGHVYALVGVDGSK